jgi:hypothetical protein
MAAILLCGVVHGELDVMESMKVVRNMGRERLQCNRDMNICRIAWRQLNPDSSLGDSLVHVKHANYLQIMKIPVIVMAT